MDIDWLRILCDIWIFAFGFCCGGAVATWQIYSKYHNWRE